jgi:hypothetical protein
VKAPLVSGIDYYVEEGRVVLTRAYHLKRGFCCNSKCKNCPYDKQAAQTERIVIVGLPGVPLLRDK